jgi:colanic acid/amylovoran biosynthesis glycosyltransferase
MKVAHFVRKKSQLDSSFIFNQILNHQKVTPVIYYAFDDHKEGLADFPLSRFSFHHLNWNENFIDKLIWRLFLKPSRRKSNQLRKLIQQEEPDVFHLHYGSDAGIFLPVLKEFNIPSMVSFYGYDCTGFPKYYFGLGKLILRNRVFPKATIITAMSENMKRDLIRLGCDADKVVIHYHGINTKLFNIERKNDSGDIIRFLMISTFTPQKGHLFLLDGFQRALDKTRTIQLTIVGSGIERDRIEKHITEQKIGNIRICNHVRYASREHLEYLLDADVFVHPSITDIKGNKEGIPGAIVEAMSIGLPVISTYHAGIPEIIKHMQTGFLVNENDINGLATSIVKLAEQPALRKALGQNAKDYAVSWLDINVKEKELEELYNQIFSSHSH